ncbi:MAG: T9SS type A sorting domain-containing protein [Saprospiraceae bacterium]|nr:T9SS type A sorting domain-containing protein [Saprospiraceae bacterium]
MKISTSKNLIALVFSVLAGFSAFGQTAITITAADMPVPTGPYNLDRITGLVPNAVPATNAVWDYATAFGNMPDIADFNPEFIPFFLDAGVDVYRLLFKNLNPNFGYEIYQEFDFNANGIDDIAVDVVEQNYTLQPFTGNINDSIFIPAQSKIVSTPRRIVEFPFTANSAWSSSSRRVTDMVFNIPAFGLNYAPVQHAYTWVRHDSIVGWGKMRVYTPDGPSIDYDVLMDKISEHTVDSFYLNGTPAPAALLTAFGVDQGQKTEETYRYNFYRKSSFGYLASFYYETDETFTNVFNAFIGTDGLETAPPSATVENISYATVLYPNPSAGSELNIKLMGGQFELGSYEVFDAMGRLVKQGQLQANGSDVQVQMGEPLRSGNYYIQLKDKQLRSIATQQFEVIN